MGNRESASRQRKEFEVSNSSDEIRDVSFESTDSCLNSQNYIRTDTKSGSVSENSNVDEKVRHLDMKSGTIPEDSHSYSAEKKIPSIEENKRSPKISSDNVKLRSTLEYRLQTTSDVNLPQVPENTDRKAATVINKNDMETETLNAEEVCEDIVAGYTKVIESSLLKLPMVGMVNVNRLIDDIVIEEYSSNFDVLHKGDDPKGIYVIIDGQVDVVSGDGQDILANMYKGDVFGEVSTLFDIPCTARVRTASECKLGVISVNIARDILDPSVDITDWFVQKKYLPTSTDLNHDKIQRRIAFTCLKEVSLVKGWSDTSIKSLIMQIQPALIIVYPPKSCLLMEGDPPTMVHLVIRGRVEIKDQDDDVIVSVDTCKDPFLIGEYGLHLQISSCITIAALTTCEVITISEGWIQNTLEKYPEDAGTAWYRSEEKWQEFADRTKILSHIYPSLLHPEVIFEMIKENDILSPSYCIHDVSMTGSPHVFQPGEVICRSSECEKMVILVLTGQIELLTRKHGNYILTKGRVFGGSEKKIKQKKLIATRQSLLWMMKLTDIQKVLSSYTGSQLTVSKLGGQN